MNKVFTIMLMAVLYAAPVFAVSVDIKVNGSDGPVDVERAGAVSLTVGVEAEGEAGEEADWWVAAATPSGWYYFDYYSGSWSFAGPSYNDLPVTYQGPLFDLGSFEVLKMTGLPEGSYTCYFGVDTSMDDSLNMGLLSYDSVKIECDGSPSPLSHVRYWAYQIQDISSAGAVEALANSHYDMLVLEPTRTDWSSDDKYFDTKGMVARLKGTYGSDGVTPKLVIAYIDIGEAEDWRWYWTWPREAWAGDSPLPAGWPDFIVSADPDGWGGNYPVAYWDKGWKDIVIYGQNQGARPDRDYNSIIDEVIKDGFDGIYLDWVEGFECDKVVQRARSEGKDPADEMIRFIREMRDYAAQRNPNFIVIQQNASALAVGRPELFSTIDAIAQEEVWYEGVATDDWSDPYGYDIPVDPALTGEYILNLGRYLDAGIPVFDCEYALQNSGAAYGKSYAKGYIPYCTRRSLSSVTTTPPPDY